MSGGTTAADDAVELRDVGVRIEATPVLSGVSLRVGRGERWVLLGPNGSGKTTLLSVAGARRSPTSGTVRILGVRIGHGDVRLLRRKIGHSSHVLAEMMPPGLSTEDVVLTGRGSALTTWFESFDERDLERARTLLAGVGCDGLGSRSFATLSQGERQRVLVARALYHEAELLILDEPAAGLDFPARERLISALETVAQRADPPAMLMATHHLEEVPPSTTHAALLRAGRVVAAGPAGDVLTESRLRGCFGIALEVARRNGRWTAMGRA